MILIITHKADFTADFVITRLNHRRIAYKRLNCEDLFKRNYSLSISNNQGFKYSLLEQSKFESVWFRRTKLPDIDGINSQEKLYVLEETDAFFSNLFATVPAYWLSEPHAVYAAENKLLQLKTAERLGFTIPPTLVTNSHELLKDFYNDCNKAVVVKPISRTIVRYTTHDEFIFTNVLNDDTINRSEQYDLTPCIFQRNIAKDYEVRITVVGKKVFAAAVRSQESDETKIDWRKKKLTFVETDVPPDIATRCADLVKSLRLQFGAIDMIRTPGGEYVFLEINPNGQWAWIEQQTGQNISDAIVSSLTETHEGT